eukprot:scaffold280792_cov42-Attheya_sp.AAC.2
MSTVTPKVCINDHCTQKDCSLLTHTTEHSHGTTEAEAIDDDTHQGRAEQETADMMLASSEAIRIPLAMNNFSRIGTLTGNRTFTGLPARESSDSQNKLSEPFPALSQNMTSSVPSPPMDRIATISTTERLPQHQTKEPVTRNEMPSLKIQKNDVSTSSSVTPVVSCTSSTSTSPDRKETEEVVKSRQDSESLIIKQTHAQHQTSIRMEVSIAHQLQSIREEEGEGNHARQSSPALSASTLERVNTVSEKSQTKMSGSDSLDGSSKILNHTKGISTAGRWTAEEHQAFLEGLKIHGREWKKVAQGIPTRNSAQIRSHAQKYFAKLTREQDETASSGSGILYDPNTGLPILQMAITSQAMNDSPDLSFPPSALTPSLIGSVNRIMTDPSGVQQEVEDTLIALRQRYRHLQIRLEQSEHRRQSRNYIPSPPSLSSGNHNDNGDNERPSHHVMGIHSAPPQTITIEGPATTSLASGLARDHWRSEERKREADGMDCANDGASAASSVSASLASMSPHREFGSEELIALHVLGGSLPQSASRDDLTRTAFASSTVNESTTAEEKEQTSPHSPKRQRTSRLEDSTS